MLEPCNKVLDDEVRHQINLYTGDTQYVNKDVYQRVYALLRWSRRLLRHRLGSLYVYVELAMEKGESYEDI